MAYSEAGETTFQRNEKGDLNAIQIVLQQEMVRFNKLLTRVATSLVDLGTAINRYINPTSWSTLGNLARCRSLPALHWLSVHGNHCGDEGVRSVRRSTA